MVGLLYYYFSLNQWNLSLFFQGTGVDPRSSGSFKVCEGPPDSRSHFGQLFCSENQDQDSENNEQLGGAKSEHLFWSPAFNLQYIECIQPVFLCTSTFPTGA
jgi:hypothetical protein